MYAQMTRYFSVVAELLVVNVEVGA